MAGKMTLQDNCAAALAAPGVGRSAIGSRTHRTRSSLEACPQHMRHAQSLLSSMCW